METSRTLVDGEIRIADERPADRGELALDRYRLLERLGAGGFGTVWRARDEQLERTVALKRIPLPSARERERALREAQATARLSHPAIVALYEACADADAFYLVSELVEGETLAELIAADELGDREILAIGLSLAAALAHAHSRGVIHRDVKPHNVLVPHRPREAVAGDSAPPPAAKLADFGGALLAGGEALTRPGDVYGTLAYMSPEQSEGQEVGPAADLYSLALVLYEALSGVNPVRDRTPAATARRIGAPIESLCRHRSDLPRELVDAVDRALTVDPDRRGALADLQTALGARLAPARARRIYARVPRTVERTAPARGRAEPAPRRAELAPGWAELAPGWDELAPRRGEPALRGDEPVSRGDDVAAGAEESPRRAPRRVLALSRVVWVGLTLAVAIWQALAGLPGVALLVATATTPLWLLPRRSGPGWIVAVAAPALGAIGLAGAYPALAGQRATARARAALGAFGFWLLALAEPLLARRLWLGPPAGIGARAGWERSVDAAATHVLGSVLTPELALGAAVWALAAVALPWVVRGRNAAVDLLAALLWGAFLLAAAPLAERALLGHASASAPRGALLGAILGGAIAICARALRGPA